VPFCSRVSANERALSFGRAAAEYERGRPEWPDEAVDHPIGELELSADAAVLDLAAGTGKTDEEARSALQARGRS
jgi:hypothetical protein